MLLENTPLFVKYLQLASNSHIICLKWDCKKNQVKTVNPSDLKKVSRTYLIQSLFTVIFLLQFLYETVKNLETSFTSKFICGIATIALPGVNLILHLLKTHASDIQLYINGLFQYIGAYTDDSFHRKKNQLEVLNLGFAKLAYYSCKICSFTIVFGLHTFDPCKSSLVGYWMIQECSPKLETTWLLHWLLKVLVLLINYKVWETNVNAALFMVVELNLLCTNTLKENLEM